MREKINYFLLFIFSLIINLTMYKASQEPFTDQIRKTLGNIQWEVIKSFLLLIIGLVLCTFYMWKSFFKFLLYYSGLMGGISLILYSVYTLLSHLYSHIIQIIMTAFINSTFIFYIISPYYMDIITFITGVLVGVVLLYWGLSHAKLSNSLRSLYNIKENNQTIRYDNKYNN